MVFFWVVSLNQLVNYHFTFHKQMEAVHVELGVAG